MRKLATVQQVTEVKPIKNADAIEAVRVNGWWVVSKKDELKVGDKVVYFEIDSVLPVCKEFEFLRKGCYVQKDWLENGEGFRLRTIKLRGQVSQGLVVPISTLSVDGNIGDDVTELLDVQKWDPPLPACLAGEVEGYFPTFIRKTDQERAQNLEDEIAEAYANGDKFEITLKLDGSSCTVFNHNDTLGICSRNLQLKLNDANAENSFVKTANESGLLHYMREQGHQLAVQAELMGPGIQGNRENLKECNLFVFDIYDIENGQYLPPLKRHFMVQDMQEKGCKIKHVPALDVDSLLPAGNVNDLLVYADGPSINHKIREGLVYKSMDGKFSFKTISNKFLLKGGE